MSLLCRGEVFAAQQGDDGIKRCAPAPRGGVRVGTERLEVKADGEALLRTGEVHEGRADDAVEHDVGVVQRCCAAGEAVQHLLGLVERGEDGALAPEQIDVAGEAIGRGSGILGINIKIDAQVLQLFGVERPGIALGGEDRRAVRVQRAQGLHQRRVLLGFGEMVEVVGVLAQVDEAKIA